MANSLKVDENLEIRKIVHEKLKDILEIAMVEKKLTLSDSMDFISDGIEDFIANVRDSTKKLLDNMEGK